MRNLILEDNAERRTAMLEQIADSLPMLGISFFETSRRDDRCPEEHRSSGSRLDFAGQ